MDEADVFHQTAAMAAMQWVNLPDFLDAFTPSQGRDLLCAEIAYGNYFGILLCRFLLFVL